MSWGMTKKNVSRNFEKKHLALWLNPEEINLRKDWKLKLCIDLPANYSMKLNGES